MREMPTKDCPHARFVSWVIRNRQMVPGLDEQQRNECPMPICRGIVFGDFDSLVEHLQTCPEVARGLYFCLEHRLVEPFPLGSSRSCKCRWVRSRSLLKSVKQGMKQGMKKAIPSSHWMPSLGGKRPLKSEEPVSLPASAASVVPESMCHGVAELTGQAVRPELPTSFSHQPPADYAPSEMGADLTSSPFCALPLEELPGEPWDYANYNQSHRAQHATPLYPQSTISSMGFSGSGSGSSVPQISPQSTLHSPGSQYPLSLNTTVGDSPQVWTDINLCGSPTTIDTGGGAVNLPWQEQRQHSSGSAPTFVESSIDTLSPACFPGLDYPLSELEDSSSQQHPPHGVSGTNFMAGENAHDPAAGFFAPLSGVAASQTPHHNANHGFPVNNETQHFEGLGYLPQGQQHALHGPGQQPIPSLLDPSLDHPVASIDELHRTFSSQDMEDIGISDLLSHEYFTNSTPTIARPSVGLAVPPSFPNDPHAAHPPFPATIAPNARHPPSPEPSPPTKRRKHTHAHQSRAATPPPGRKGNLLPTPTVSPTLPPEPEKKEPWPCSECEYVAHGRDRRKLMERHAKTHKEEEDVYECGFVGVDGVRCEKGYNRVDNLGQHRRKVGHAGGCGEGAGRHGDGKGEKTARARRTRKRRGGSC